MLANRGVAGESGVTRIGTSGTQTKAFVAGIYGSTSASGLSVMVNSSGQLGTTTSSLRFKEKVADMGAASDGGAPRQAGSAAAPGALKHRS